jgi:hypothetical protein
MDDPGVSELGYLDSLLDSVIKLTGDQKKAPKDFSEGAFF